MHASRSFTESSHSNTLGVGLFREVVEMKCLLTTFGMEHICDFITKCGEHLSKFGDIIYKNKCSKVALNGRSVSGCAIGVRQIAFRLISV